LTVTPYLDVEERGLFATRAPRRPNPIGLTAVRLLEVDVGRGRLQIEGVDMLGGTPLLDIKPYFPAFEPDEAIRAGWLENVQTDRVVADDRFGR